MHPGCFWWMRAALGTRFHLSWVVVYAFAGGSDGIEKDSPISLRFPRLLPQRLIPVEQTWSKNSVYSFWFPTDAVHVAGFWMSPKRSLRAKWVASRSRISVSMGPRSGDSGSSSGIDRIGPTPRDRIISARCVKECCPPVKCLPLRKRFPGCFRGHILLPGHIDE